MLFGIYAANFERRSFPFLSYKRGNATLRRTAISRLMKTTNAIFPIGNKRAKSGKNARVGDMKRIRSGDGRAIQQLVSTAHKQASHSKH